MNGLELGFLENESTDLVRNVFVSPDFFLCSRRGMVLIRQLNTEHILDGLVSFGHKILVIFIGVLRLQVGLAFLEFQD